MTTHARMITRPQQGKLLSLCYGLSREVRLARISGYVGREIASTSQLSQDEATLVIDWLSGQTP